MYHTCNNKKKSNGKQKETHTQTAKGKVFTGKMGVNFCVPKQATGTAYEVPERTQLK